MGGAERTGCWVQAPVDSNVPGERFTNAMEQRGDCFVERAGLGEEAHDTVLCCEPATMPRFTGQSQLGEFELTFTAFVLTQERRLALNVPPLSIQLHKD